MIAGERGMCCWCEDAVNGYLELHRDEWLNCWVRLMPLLANAV